MVRSLGLAATIFVIVGRDVHFAADDGLDAVRHCLVVEVGCGEQIAVIGDGDGRHPASSGFSGQFADFASAVEKRVVRVQMKVNKVRSGHAKPF